MHFLFPSSFSIMEEAKIVCMGQIRATNGYCTSWELKMVLMVFFKKKYKQNRK